MLLCLCGFSSVVRGWYHLPSLIVQLQNRMWDYRHRTKERAEHVVIERFRKLHGNDVDAIWDREKRVKFGAEWCDPASKEYKFIWGGFDKTPVSHANFIFSPLTHFQRQGRRTGKFASECIVETLSVHYQFSQPGKEISNILTLDPIGGLALSVAAVSNLVYSRSRLISR